MGQRHLHPVAGLVTLVYLAYQYWDVLYKAEDTEDELECQAGDRLSRSRSRSTSRSRRRAAHFDQKAEEKHGRRRRPHRRCSDCSLCNYDD